MHNYMKLQDCIPIYEKLHQIASKLAVRIRCVLENERNPDQQTLDEIKIIKVQLLTELQQVTTFVAFNAHDITIEYSEWGGFDQMRVLGTNMSLEDEYYIHLQKNLFAIAKKFKDPTTATIWDSTSNLLKYTEHASPSEYQELHNYVYYGLDELTVGNVGFQIEDMQVHRFHQPGHMFATLHLSDRTNQSEYQYVVSLDTATVCMEPKSRDLTDVTLIRVPFQRRMR
jgi:hypothetical protein